MRHFLVFLLIQSPVEVLDVIVALSILWIVHWFITVPAAAGVGLSGVGEAGVVSSSLTVPLVAPGVQGVAGDVDTPLGTASAVSNSLTTIEYCQLQVTIHQRSTEVVYREL